MARKQEERDWAQLDAFEAEYAERLQAEKKRERRPGDSQFLDFLRGLARNYERFYADEVNARDSDTGRLFSLRGKILGLRDKLGDGQPPDKLLPVEIEILKQIKEAVPESDKGDKPRPLDFARDPLPPAHLYPVTLKEIKATLGELPPEHAATVWRVHLTNQKRTGTDGDWLDGEIRLHCLLAEFGPGRGRRLVGRSEGTQDVERFGGALEWEGSKLFAVWPVPAYKTFVLRRVLIHEVAHGVAELPGFADRVRTAGSVEKFCEQYAENFHRPAGPSVRLGF